MQTWIRTCSLCEATCGLKITTDEGGAIVEIRADEDDVFSRGFMCPKGHALKDLHEDPDRLRRPLVRRDGRHVEVSWEEAFKVVEAGLAPILAAGDREALGIYLGNPNVHNMAGLFYLRPLIKAMGTRNVFSASTIDQMPRHVSCGLMFGGPGLIPVPDLDRTDFLLMLGANPMDSNGSLCTAPDFPSRLKDLRARGGRLVVVDPRRTRTAKRADEHLFIRPGADAHLLVALAHALFDEGLVDPGALRPHLSGLDALPALLAPFSPEAVAAHCGIDAATTRRIARQLAAAPRAAVYGRLGAHAAPFGTLASWAADLLNALTGNLDRPGGVMFPLSAHARQSATPGGRGFATGRWSSRARSLPEVNGELPAATLTDEILTPGPGQLRALVTVAGNPALSNPNADRLDAALAALDFMVSVDLYLNETTRHADVILPPPSPLARGHYDAAFYDLAVRNVANYSPPIFAPEGPPEHEILARLALIVSGQGAAADPALVDGLILSFVLQRAAADPASPLFGQPLPEIMAALPEAEGPERVLDALLRSGAYAAQGMSLDTLRAHPHGVDLGPLLPRLPQLLDTPSGLVELTPAPIVADLPRLAAALDEPSPGLLLIGRRHLRSNNSWMHNLTPLVRGKGRCTLQIHPDDAARLGLGEGAEATIASRVGQVRAPVEITEDLMPGVVSLPHGWGHGLPGAALRVAAEHPGVNSNTLTDEQVLDPLSGNCALNAIPVTVAP